jgi:ATP-dependent helicase HrpA
MHELGHRENTEPADYPTLHRALLSGLLSHIGLRGQGKERDYLGARNRRFHVFPGSALFGRQPKWLMAAELVETTRLYARTAAAIEPEWIEPLAGHLVKQSYSSPRWQGRRGQVAADEKVTLYGLPVVPRRRVNYGPIDPPAARELFIRHGLTEGDMDTRAPFWRHNRDLIADLRALEAKTRSTPSASPMVSTASPSSNPGCVVCRGRRASACTCAWTISPGADWMTTHQSAFPTPSN